MRSTRRDRTRARGTAALAGITGLLLVGALAAGGACKQTTYRLSTFQFSPLHPIEVVSAFPAVRSGDGTYVRQCDALDGAGKAATADALMFSISLLGTEVSSGEDEDRDNSIRPGDHLKVGPGTDRPEVVLGETIGERDFEVELLCLEPYPDPDLRGDARCQGQEVRSQTHPARLEYRSHFDPDEHGLRPSPRERDSLDIAFLVDQSGSMKGFVDPQEGKEAKPNAYEVYATDFARFATDRNGVRLSAVKAFSHLLNDNSRVAVFQFNEETGPGARIVCDLPDVASETDRRKECFGTNRSLVFGCSADEIAAGCQDTGKAFNELASKPRGRTPLWAAVADVYRFLRDQSTARVRHLVVFTDGPDTCHPDSPDFEPVLRGKKKDKFVEFKQENACSTVSFDDLLAELQADLAQADASLPPARQAPVHVSFVQIQAPGYRDRDPRQQEIACRTGGHHLFVNAQDLPAADNDSSALDQALVHLAVPRLRSALAGTWTLAVDVPDLATGRLPAGAELAVEGAIRMFDGDVTVDAEYPLRVGYVASAGQDNIPGLDQRVAFRRPCGSGDSCGWYPPGDCTQVACRGGDAVCVASPALDPAACGSGGACCWGACLTPANPCQAFDDLCNPVNVANDTQCAQGVCCNGECKAACP